MKKQPITSATVQQVLERSKGKCEAGCPVIGVSIHHINAKSKYFGKDLNWAWNLANLCEYHHRILHHAGTDKEAKEKNQLDYYLKNKALIRRPLGYTKELQLAVNRAKFRV